MPKALIDYDKHGHCVICHEVMIIEQVIDGEVRKRFTPDYDETEYLLDDDSKMRVAICKPCKEIMKDDQDERDLVMECVFKGWEAETLAMDWSKEKRNKYLNRYKLKKIIVRSEHLSKHALKKEAKKYKEKQKVK